MYQYTSGEFRLAARTLLKQKLMNFMVVSAIYIVVTTLLSWLSSEIAGINAWTRQFSDQLYDYMDRLGAVATPEQYADLMEQVTLPTFDILAKGPFAVVLSWLVSLMVSPVSAGYTYHILQETRGVRTNARTMLYGFKVTLKSILIGLLTGILTGLGYMLFIIPGIVLTLRYSMAVYILLEDPSKGTIQCMRESGQLMRGHKWRLFKLSFSFFGWLLLSALVTSLIGVPLFDIWLTPYMALAQAGFYNELRGLQPPIARFNPYGPYSGPTDGPDDGGGQF